MEEELIRKLRRSEKSHPLIDLGIGDDAAIFHLGSERRGLVTSDMLMDGVHFSLESTPLPAIGRKALAVNLSDIAAMAGQPLAAFVSVALPRNSAMTIADGIYMGMQALALEFDVAIAGGDTNVWDGPLVINVTLLGLERVGGSVLRSGARVGDIVLVTGSLGGSIAGRHLSFQPRVAEAQVLADRYGLTALTDISDGLASDLRDLCDESGIGIELNAAVIPIAHNVSGDDRLRAAMCDGEDFELAFTMAPGRAERLLRDQPLKGLTVTAIGRVVNDPGLFWIREDGRMPCSWGGYKHNS